MEEELHVLEDFLMEIEILGQIESKLSSFNVFETLDLFHTEIRHSNVLAWLLKPLENHGIGETFIKKLMQSIFIENREYMKKIEITILSLTTMDFSDLQVLREWRNIDIFAVQKKIN